MRKEKVHEEENVISEHEGNWEDISHRDQFLDPPSKCSLRNPNHCIVDLSKDVADDCSIFENHAIIGRVVGPKFPRKSIRSWADEHWGKHVVIKFLPKSFFVAVFAEEEERYWIFCSQNWFFDSHPFYLQPWYPNFDPTQLAIYDKPLWVCLYNLPSEYWSNPCLECIGRTLGTLLEICEAIIDADLYIYARIKIVAVKEIPPSISIITNEGSWVQQVEIEKDITSCTRCGSRRHPVERCRMFFRRVFKKPPNKSGKVWNHIPPTKSELSLLIGPIFANTDPPPKQLSQDNGTASKAPIYNNTPHPGLVSPSPPPNQDDTKEDRLSAEGSKSSWPNEEPENLDDLDILDPRCISQFANTLLGRAKGSKGRISHKVIHEQRAHEMGIVSVIDYLKVSKGGNTSLGER
ncbi:hypothetical protein SUGI_0056100 [Cryptomeria japonica]|nr:hypothetical protein SUGI_0056100 [Cryptomeria japonica]